MLIDFHSHILPGADHGSDGITTSLRQLELAKEAGVDTVVATPHFYPHRMTLESFLARRSSCYDKLMSEYRGPVDVKVGSEVLVCRGMNRMSGLEQLCVSGTNVLLLEMPSSNWSESLIETVIELDEDPRFHVVMAHIDRYDMAKVRPLINYGIHCQINAESLTKVFSRKKYLGLVDEGAVVAIGSDIHGTDIGYKQFDAAKRYLGDRLSVVMERTRRLIGVDDGK